MQSNIIYLNWDPMQAHAPVNWSNYSERNG